MTRERIAELLSLVVLEMANNLPAPRGLGPAPSLLPGDVAYATPAIVVEAEWAYVKGLASGAVLRLHAELTR